MKVISNLILILIIARCCQGVIVPCQDSVESKVCFLVEKQEDYISTLSPQPYPTIIDISFYITDVVQVNDESQTVTLMMKMFLSWVDSRLSVRKSKKDNES